MAIHLVTGATDGIGKQTALELSKLGHTVLVHGRSEKRAVEAVKSLGEGHYEPIWADLSVMSEVHALADRVKAVDVLINNAGVFMKERVLSQDGFEMTMAVNHFSPFVLTHRLLPRVSERVVHVSSMAHARGRLLLDDLTLSRGWDGYGSYATSKLANVLFSNELARRQSRVTSNALHPGVINTKLLTVGFGVGGAPLQTGALTSVYCATSPELAKVSGAYFSDARRAEPSRAARDEKLARDFYEASCRLTGVAPL